MKPTGHARQTIAFSAPLMKTPRLLFLWQELYGRAHLAVGFHHIFY